MNARKILFAILFIFSYLFRIPAAVGAETAVSSELITTQIGTGSENSSVLRDKYGFLWLGTKNGLQCFDGNGRSVYKANSEPLRGISNISVSALFENGDDILIGGNAGLHVFDRATNTISRFPYRTKYGVTISALVGKIINAGQGRIWIATQGQGFFIFNKADRTLVQNSRQGSFYSDMAIGANGLVYLASITGCIQAFRPDGEFVGESRLPNYTTDKNRILIAASGKDLWIAAGSHLYCFHPDTGEIVPVPDGDMGATVNTMLARPDGTILLGTNAGLWSYKTISGGEVTPLTPLRSGSTMDLRVNALFTDVNDDVIIVHPSAPLEILTKESPAFRFVALPPSGTASYGYNSVRAFALSDEPGKIWVGSDNGLDLFDMATATFSRAAPPDGSYCKSVTSLLYSDGRLWIGTRTNGVIVYDTRGNSWRRYVYDENIPYTVISNEINDIFRTSSGDIYVLTNWGVCRYDPVADNFPQLTDFGQQTGCISMEEDLEHGLWIATANYGIHYRRPGERRFHNDIFGTGGEPVPAKIMYVGTDGRLWAATQNSGLYYYDPASYAFPSLELSLLNHNTVSFLTGDKSGALWIGTNDFLIRLDGDSSASLYNFSHRDEWLPVAGGVQPLDDGATLIGCRGGFLVFDPAKLKPNIDKIKTYPQSLSFPFLDDDSGELQDLGLNILLYTTNSVRLPYENNTFTIHLSAARPMSVPDIRYDYMLEGVDKSWITGLSGSEVTYNNLPSGNYNFLLRPHGVKNAEVSSLQVRILPPWYLTGWAYCLYFVLGALIVWAAIIVIRKVLKRKYHRQLHDMRIQKEREVFEAKTRYFVDLVHEIRTPLMLISLPLEQLAEEENGAKATHKASKKPKYIRSMQRNIDYLLGITNQLLDFRRAENSSEIRLSLSRCNVNKLLYNICRRFEEPMKISGKMIEQSYPDHDVITQMDEDKTERLLMNLIGNAMKYARKNIRITLSDTDEDFCITVADDGPGVPKEEQERIFDAYYQIGNDDVAASLGTGLGLAYAKLIAVAHNGNITVSDNTGGGALFTLTVPKNNVADTTGDELPDGADFGQDADIPADRDKNILLVEDNDDLREMITEALGRHYTVITAIDGCMALDILKANNIDVIVSDVMMPRMNGLDLCRRVKHDINYSHIPFIILTAKTGREAQTEGMECGADVYLEKPFPIRQLACQIANLLRTRRQFCEHIRRTIGQEAPGSSPVVTDSPGLNRIDTEFLERMNEIISESIANEEFSIDRLAENLNLSRSSFYRKITAVTGMSPSDYLKNYRLNYAATLLNDGCRISEVSDRVGFASSSYFARCFKERFGMLPSEYVASRTSAGRAENGQ